MPNSLDYADLIRDYTPLMVLYPEIQADTNRETNPDYPHDSPLTSDYHPRDIKLVLDQSSVHGRIHLGRGSVDGWQALLDQMESAGYSNDMDVLPGANPNERDRFWSAYAAIPKDSPGHARACYARVVEGQGVLQNRILVQYWYPYFYNDFWNTHEMDWETVMVIFANGPGGTRPTVCAYTAHMGGHWLRWENVHKANDALEPEDDVGKHPVVYVANGSHGNYFYGPALYPTAPPLASMAADLLKKPGKLIDYTTSWDEGERHLVEAQIIPPGTGELWTGDWRWLNWKGRWGSAGKWFDLEFGDSSPYGPPQSGSKWETPFSWIDTNCLRAPTLDDSLVPSRI